MIWGEGHAWVVTALTPVGKGVTICPTSEHALAAISDALKDPEGVALVEKLRLDGPSRFKVVASGISLDLTKEEAS